MRGNTFDDNEKSFEHLYAEFFTSLCLRKSYFEFNTVQLRVNIFLWSLTVRLKRFTDRFDRKQIPQFFNSINPTVYSFVKAVQE